ELSEQPISSPKEYGNEKTTPANEEHQRAAVEVHHAEDEDGLLPPPPPPPEINFSANENIKNEVGVSHDIIPPPPKPPGQNDMVDGVESPSTSYLQSAPQNNDEQNAEEDNEESVKETTFEEREITDDECEENIDSLLEKPFADGDKPGKIPIPEEGQMREKIVLAHRGVDYFDVLPEGWVELTHTSGLPVYLHKSSRVCTFSRPYFIGPSSVRHHHVPESAIPCLHQRRVLRDLDESAKLSADALQNALNMNSDMNESDNKNKSNDNLLNEEKAKLIATLQAPNTKVQVRFAD
ncbi:unnamed protein product, partial [Anisakis simplex]|uniref:Microprocessor complex subunit DGCR8 (inferred by orthology to a human protein) n=1 Tax=Anisakis simplex TaxID=6269 RepID=A0A0M3JB23_ANISI